MKNNMEDTDKGQKQRLAWFPSQYATIYTMWNVKPTIPALCIKLSKNFSRSPLQPMLRVASLREKDEKQDRKKEIEDETAP